MDNSNSHEKNDQFLRQLQESASQLVENLQQDDLGGASEIIHKLVEVRDTHIFNSVGKLTRALHEAIVNFNVDCDLSSYPLVNNSEIKDASDRLNYVIKMTHAAANKTLDKVEVLAPLATNLGQEAGRLKREWMRLQNGDISKEEFKSIYHSIGDFLEQMDAGTNELNKNLQDIIVEQSYQDITGQVLEKVIGLVTDVERELVNLMRMAGHVEQVTGLANEKKPAPKRKKGEKTKLEGPQVHADKRDDVVSSQDEVDKLLSSLGF